MALTNLALIIFLTHPIILLSFQCTSATRTEAPTSGPEGNDIKVVKSGITYGDKFLENMKKKISVAKGDDGNPEQCLVNCMPIFEEWYNNEFKKAAIAFTTSGAQYDGPLLEYANGFTEECLTCYGMVDSTDPQFLQDLKTICRSIEVINKKFESINS